MQNRVISFQHRSIVRGSSLYNLTWRTNAIVIELGQDFTATLYSGTSHNLKRALKSCSVRCKLVYTVCSTKGERYCMSE